MTISVFIVVAAFFFVEKSNLVPFVPKSTPALAGESALDRPLLQAVASVTPAVPEWCSTPTATTARLTLGLINYFAYGRRNARLAAKAVIE